MTQEEKFEEAKRLYETANADQRYVLESLFPELRESEGERIRKEIISAIKEDWPGHTDWITWLEKQAQKSAAWSEGDKNMLKWVIGYLENKMLNAPISEERIACKNAIAWLEEKLKGEQKTNPCDGCINRKGCINCENGELRETEQKHAGKVEPKFKVGDWISGYYTNYKILSVNNNGYVVEDVDGNKINILFENEKFHHLWTIQDAKDGDVLHCWIDGDEFVLIYKGIKDGYITTYGHLYQKLKAFSEEPTTMFCRTIQGHFTPATKEQCDLLFQKMHKAGYEWDTEKKELKKIEQKPVEWTMDNIEELTEFENAMMHIGGSFFGEHQGLDPNDTFVVKEQAKILLEMATKQELSEEDTRLLENCISLIEDIDCTEDEQNWLKALKYRLQPQPQWNKEDETKIKSIIALLKNPAVCSMDGNKGIIDASIKYLKSLKNRVQPQPKQEWSQNDIDMIDWLIRCCEKEHEELCNDKYGHQDIVSDLKRDCRKKWDWLESLKNRVAPQNTWKPSDEQMDALLVKIPIKNSCNKVDNILKSLYSDLKKLK